MCYGLRFLSPRRGEYDLAINKENSSDFGIKTHE